MSRINKPHNRCPLCKMLLDRCLCAQASECKNSLATLQTRVIILMHHRERHLTTNTARLATLCLPHCELHIRGLRGHPLDVGALIEDPARTLLLYPTENAAVLDKDFVQTLARPLTLIVPDGSWRQASKLSKREAVLSKIPHVKLSSSKPSAYRLRREPKAEGLATFEAIARALGILEAEATQAKLEKIFDAMVVGTLRSRGFRAE